MPYSDARSPWQPETYAELGAAVPFTSPELTGARARCGKAGLELTLPNPSGKRGVYILDPKDMTRFCMPTLHDRQLVACLAAAPAISPGTMRDLARSVAMAGFAGRPAAAAARLAQEDDRKAALAAQLAILRLLVQQIGGEASDTAGLDRAAKSAIAGLAASSGQTPAEIVQAINRASRIAAVSGFTGGDPGRHPDALARLSATAQAASDAVQNDIGRAAQAARLILSASSDTIALANKSLSQIWRLLSGLAPLLTAYAKQGAALEVLAVRLDWLLDGWAPLCQVWDMAAPGRVCAAINEMGLMVPVIPAEAGAWLGLPVHEASRQALRAEIVGYNDWRSGGLACDLLARNEAARAMAA